MHAANATGVNECHLFLFTLLKCLWWFVFPKLRVVCSNGQIISNKHALDMIPELSRASSNCPACVDRFFLWQPVNLTVFGLRIKDQRIKSRKKLSFGWHFSYKMCAGHNMKSWLWHVDSKSTGRWTDRPTDEQIRPLKANYCAINVP